MHKPLEDVSLQAIHRELLFRAYDVVKALPPEDRRLLALGDWDGMTWISDWQCFRIERLPTQRNGQVFWNPVKEDGDALRFAMACHVLPCHMDLFHAAYADMAGRLSGSTMNLGGAADCTRYALVRAGVEAQEQMAVLARQRAEMGLAG